ncbi:hypothetical protein V2G26_002183 [Clonostachys chloroleuca]
MGYEVVALSSTDDKANFARDLGAAHFIKTKTQDVGAELKKLAGAAVVVQTAPNPPSINPLVAGLAAEGKIPSLAPAGIAETYATALMSKGASLVGWPSGHALDSEDGIRFALRHDVRCLINKYPLSGAQKAIDDFKAGKARFRNVLIV